MVSPSTLRGPPRSKAPPKTPSSPPPFSFYHTVSLAARTPNVSKEHLEEFNNHLRCLGFTEEDMFFTSEKV